jgi:tyramine---L-glutamate ligase
MHRALLSDLSAIPDLTLISARASRLPVPELAQSARSALSHPFSSASSSSSSSSSSRWNPGARFEAGVEAADAVWLVAPEFGGILERLSRHVLRRKRILLGSTPGAVRVASSKLRTVRILARAGVTVVDTYSPHDTLPGNIDAWVVKPDNGSGCIDTRLFSGAGSALAWIAANGGERYVLQPFIAGQPCSLSLICCDGVARVLGCNEQRIAVRDNQFHFLGSTVNRMTDSTGQFERLAQKIVAAIPGLWGYVGIDFILAGNGAIVLEVNPRMTTSCAGLHASLGCNPAQLVLGLLRGPAGLDLPSFKPVAVSVDVGEFDTL